MTHPEMAFEAGRLSALYLRLREEGAPPDVLAILRRSVMRLAKGAYVSLDDDLDGARAVAKVALVKS